MRFWRRVVDLSHPLSADIPIWPGDPRPAFTTLATVVEHGYYLRQVAFGEHAGTHLGTAAHMKAGGITVDELRPEELLAPAVVINVQRRIPANPDFVLSLADIREWEARHGAVPPDCVVLMATGWDARWSEPARYLNADQEGIMHFPGFAAETVSWLTEARRVRGLGIDTPGIDPGQDRHLRSNRYLLQQRRFHLENLTRLVELPPTGVWLFIGALPLTGASGSPARVLALIQQDKCERGWG